MIVLAHLHQMSELMPGHLRSAELHPQGGLVDDDVLGGRAVPEEYGLAFDPERDAVLDVGGRELRHVLAENLPRVLRCLEQPGDVDGDRSAQSLRVMLALGEVEKGWRQDLSVLLPPATRTVGGHVAERCHHFGVRAPVVVGQSANPLRTDAYAARLHVADLVLLHAQQLACLRSSEAGTFTELAQFAAKAQLAACRIGPHRSVRPLERLVTRKGGSSLITRLSVNALAGAGYL